MVGGAGGGVSVTRAEGAGLGGFFDTTGGGGAFSSTGAAGSSAIMD